MMPQLLEHPLSVDAASISGVVKDVDLPERQQEFPRNRIAHYRGMIASDIRNRKAILLRENRCSTYSEHCLLP
jgi:hypothetical protein